MSLIIGILRGILLVVSIVYMIKEIKYRSDIHKKESEMLAKKTDREEARSSLCGSCKNLILCCGPDDTLDGYKYKCQWGDNPHDGWLTNIPPALCGHYKPKETDADETNTNTD